MNHFCYSSISSPLIARASRTAQAFVTVYKALPEEVRQEVKRMITDKAPDQEGDNAAQRKYLADRLRANPVRIPGDFKFNRDEADER